MSTAILVLAGERAMGNSARILAGLRERGDGRVVRLARPDGTLAVRIRARAACGPPSGRRSALPFPTVARAACPVPGTVAAGGSSLRPGGAGLVSRLRTRPGSGPGASRERGLLESTDFLGADGLSSPRWAEGRPKSHAGRMPALPGGRRSRGAALAARFSCRENYLTIINSVKYAYGMLTHLQ